STSACSSVLGISSARWRRCIARVGLPPSPRSRARAFWSSTPTICTCSWIASPALQSISVKWRAPAWAATWSRARATLLSKSSMRRSLNRRTAAVARDAGRVAGGGATVSEPLASPPDPAPRNRAGAETSSARRGRSCDPAPVARSVTATKTDDKSAGKCPVAHVRTKTNRDWWPNQLDVQVLHRNSNLSDPMGEEFDYAKEFKSLDLNGVIKDLHALMADSQNWCRPTLATTAA